MLIDILQLSFLIYLTGGITNPFSIFLIIPTVFSSSNLDLEANLLLSYFITTIIINNFFTFFKDLPLPYPVNEHFHVNDYYYYSIPLALIIALIFLNYFALTFGTEVSIKKRSFK